jgi:hypothetical protein
VVELAESATGVAVTGRPPNMIAPASFAGKGAIGCQSAASGRKLPQD